jgi:hypothetical protein
MIKNHNGMRVIFCSFCDSEEAAMSRDFKECIDEWKDAGWRMFKEDVDNPEWKHICPSCREESKRQFARRREEKGGDFD